ncbi:MAG: hypothetical protein ACI9O8_001415, partial [Patiriisocius sp.]
LRCPFFSKNAVNTFFTISWLFASVLELIRMAMNRCAMLVTFYRYS